MRGWLRVAVDAERMYASPMRTEFSPDDLLTSVAYDEPLIANGVRCHGGFVGGRYHSPRSVGRGPAIAAWQAQLRQRAACR